MSGTLRRWASVGVTLLLLAVTVDLTGTTLLRRVVDGDFRYTLWADRDLLRAARLAIEPQFAGAELSFGTGARVPGGLLYQLLAVPLRWSSDPGAAYRFQSGLDALGLVLLFACAARLLGARPALLAVAVVTASPVSQRVLAELWNPGLVPLFAAIGWVGAALLVRTRDARFLALSGLGFALAAQLHLSAWLPLVGVLLLAPWLRPTHVRAGLALLALGLVATLGPYVLHEAATGWSNTLQFGDSRQARFGAPDVVSASSLVHFVEPWTVTSGDPIELAARSRPIRFGVGNLPLLLLLLSPLTAVRAPTGARGGARALLLGLAVPFVGTLLWFSFEATIDLLDNTTGKQRYLMVLVPGYAWMVAAAWRAWTDRLGERLADAMGLLAAAVVVAQGTSLLPALPAGDPERASVQADWLDAVRAATGQGLRELSGRTVVVRDAPDVPTLGIPFPIDYRLHVAGEAPSGSLPPPCLAILPVAATVDHLRARSAAEVVVLDERPLPHGARLVRWTPGADALCPTNLVDRYVLRPEETRTLALLDPGTPATLVDGALSLARVEADGVPAFHVATELVEGASGRALVLHGSALRGPAYNNGLFVTVGLERPALVVDDGTGPRRLELGTSRLGMEGAVSPVTVTLPPGLGERFSARLVATVREPTFFRLGDDPGVPLDALIREP